MDLREKSGSNEDVKPFPGWTLERQDSTGQRGQVLPTVILESAGQRGGASPCSPAGTQSPRSPVSLGGREDASPWGTRDSPAGAPPVPEPAQRPCTHLSLKDGRTHFGCLYKHKAYLSNAQSSLMTFLTDRDICYHFFLWLSSSF